MTDRKLVLLRHAKAAHPEHNADMERALTPRGQADAEAAGRWLANERVVPDIVLCSPARRARETWHALASTLGAEASHTTVLYEPGIYTAVIGEELLPLISSTQPEATTLVVIGHNPPLSMLSALLDPTLDEGLQTCGIAVHRVNGGWHDLTPGNAPLTDLHTARA
ncbi:histidine phosphatase family protein [Planosporangium flavigriseum]|uniref:Phosphohistidine phosphatase n=1 Tax=Planosporangium flavigriseum TaxID=373681 RepID=A0A8J3LR15_9ACTN|nr:histidine phosphatase family protein [Planosporangium flavigriseum]NJC64400.1 histidine phosphatase family protein [Planosporangium flavigriseum]GIG72126.1 phosphohistidine phosphatase [Planosporangium flavigriseum]